MKKNTHRIAITAIVMTLTGLVAASFVFPLKPAISTTGIASVPDEPRPRVDGDWAPVTSPREQEELADALARAELERLNRQVGQLQNAIAVLVENQSLTQSMLDDLETLPEAALPALETAPQPPSPEEEAQQHQAEMDRMQQRLDLEAPDGKWASETIGRIEDSLQHEELEGISLVDARCGSTLCKVDMALPDGSPEEALNRLAIHRGWDGATILEMSPSGQARFYIARNGYDLNGKALETVTP